ncbi:hypothetical protein BUALT_Bualt16G0044900 [Buddleja alternifolia]|uniref:Protein FAR1-RELATED SEQUENCE n=2 Tax=Buddleja alternifolia TaxID=168488 RepID=A0AAV6WGV8_9LAMI|nr:hypothetical protein BUALT_Bualt16G0044900 [Buddleja alternifolia]
MTFTAVPQMKSIYHMKLKHQDAIRLVECLLKKMESLTEPEAFAIFFDAMILASGQGIQEVIEMIVNTFPAAIHCHELATNYIIFHIAVKNRCENVYNLVYRMGAQKNNFADLWDNSGNSLLHLCAELAPPHKLNLVSGAALQMQRELQWFKFPLLVDVISSTYGTGIFVRFCSTLQLMDKNTFVDLTDCRKLDFHFDEAEKGKKELLDNGSGEKLITECQSTVLQEKIPNIGMEFDNEKAAYNFYNEYAKLVGFGIRNHNVHNDENGRIINGTFCCACQGHRGIDKRDVNVKSHRPETRTGCEAMLKIDGRQKSGKYKVVNFITDHNGHDLVSPSKTHMLRSHRPITVAQASQADDIEMSGITPKAEFLLMARQVDEDYQIANIFCVDAQMMVDYAYFGDVVCFDTTYRENKEGRPFTLFVGVNHNKQSIVFGASLLYDETASTFMWLFDTFARAMSGKKPKTILTDQDAAMAKALATKWPETYHRFTEDALGESGNASTDVVIRGLKNKEKKPAKYGKRQGSGLEKSTRKKKQKQDNVSSSNNEIERGIIMRIPNNNTNGLSVDASIESSSLPSLSQLSQEYQVGLSNLSVVYPNEGFSLSNVEPFQFPQISWPIVYQQHTVTPYPIQNQQKGTSLMELLQQQLMKPQGFERLQSNNFAQSQSTNDDNGHGDVLKGS